jgi:hypothetical protein
MSTETGGDDETVRTGRRDLLVKFGVGAAAAWTAPVILDSAFTRAAATSQLPATSTFTNIQNSYLFVYYTKPGNSNVFTANIKTGSTGCTTNASNAQCTQTRTCGTKTITATAGTKPPFDSSQTAATVCAYFAGTGSASGDFITLTQGGAAAGITVIGGFAHCRNSFCDTACSTDGVTLQFSPPLTCTNT